MGVGQVAPQPLQPSGRRVHVRVDEAGQQHPVGQVDHLRAGAGQLADLRVGADGDDSPAAYTATAYAHDRAASTV
jgi:hypothetical protein